MSSNQRKKISFFNFGRSRAPAPSESTAPAKTEPTALAVDIADTEVNAAVLHSTKDDATSEKPSTSGRGQFRRFANFFKRNNAANSRKVVKQANAAAEDVPLSATCPAEIDQCQMEALQQQDDLSLKEDGAKEEKNATDVDAEVKKVKAVTKIQAIFRGVLARKHVADMKGSSSKVADTEEQPSTEEMPSNTLVTSPL